MIPTSPNFDLANAALQKKPVITITISGYSRVFATLATGVSGQYDWIESIEDHSITVNDLDGGADLGEFGFTVQDRGGAITASFPSFVFEGKGVVVKTGFVGMAQVDFATLFTGMVDTVASANGGASYTFTCVNVSAQLAKVIYTTANGKPTDSDNLRILSAHPLDLMLSALLTEVGLDESQVDLGRIQSYRDGVFAGLAFQFAIDSPPAAQDFIESQILKPLGGYMWINSKGQVTVNFFYKQIAVTSVTVNGLSRPWLQGGINASYAYDDTGSTTNPTSIPVVAGQPVTLLYSSGTVSIGPGTFPFTDPVGIPSTSGGGAGYPGFYTGATGRNGACIGAFADSSGQLLAAPFFTGTSGTWTPPTGATQLLLGVDDTRNFNDNAGAWLFGVSGAGSAVFTIAANEDNIDDSEGPPLALQSDMVNQVSFRFDKSDDGKYLAESINTYAASLVKYGQSAPVQIIESDGMRSSLQGFFESAFVARMIFLRYGLKNQRFEDVPLFWSCCALEPGDLVSLTDSHIPDRDAGVIGISGKLFEVLDRTWHFDSLTVSVTLIDASYLGQFAQYLIAPNGKPAWTSATTADKAKYMYMANTSGQYSDATPAHVIG